jgi:acetolactate synthase-1/2/3 large subunit
MPLIVPANEQGAGFMAAGYARASGRVGVCLVTSGPGATNTVTPVRDCMADSIPMVVICGQVPTSAIGSDAFQEAPVAALMGSVAKHIFLVTDATQLEATVRTAFEIARTGRPGPVVVDLPKDVQNYSGTFQGEGKLAIPMATASACSPPTTATSRTTRRPQSSSRCCVRRSARCSMPAVA